MSGHDHIVVGKDEHASLKALKLIWRLRLRPRSSAHLLDFT
jgi:hypothetical protein